MLATLLPSLTTSWISYVENQRALTAKASGELVSVSGQTAREVDLWIKERRYDLRVFTNSYEVTENIERIPWVRGEPVRAGRAFGRLNDYLTSVRERFVVYDELLVLDPHGHIIASSATRARPVVLPDDWQTELRRTDLVMGTPYWDSTAQRPEMVMAVPIRSTTRLLGALTARINLQTVADTLVRFKPGEGGRIYLMTDAGRLVVGSTGSSAALMQLQYAPDVARLLLAREGRAVQFGSLPVRERVVGVARRIPALGWVVVAEIPAAEAFRQMARLRNITLLILTTLLAAVGLLGYFLGLLIVRPLDRLTTGAAQVAAGSLDVDLPVVTGGELGYLTHVFNNMVTRLREGRQELERLSVTDHLTGLYNRRRMMEALENEVRRSRRLKHTFAVLMADVDHFKHYNDAHGHPAGDEVLKRVAAVLRKAARDVDLVARYGGEEFFVLMPETGGDGAADVADRVRGQLAAETLPGGAVTLSFGVAEFPAHGDTAETLIAIADAALYQAKREGRDRVILAPGAAERRRQKAGPAGTKPDA